MPTMQTLFNRTVTGAAAALAQNISETATPEGFGAFLDGVKQFLDDNQGPIIGVTVGLATAGAILCCVARCLRNRGLEGWAGMTHRAHRLGLA